MGNRWHRSVVAFMYIDSCRTASNDRVLITSRCYSLASIDLKFIRSWIRSFFTSFLQISFPPCLTHICLNILLSETQVKEPSFDNQTCVFNYSLMLEQVLVNHVSSFNSRTNVSSQYMI